MYDELIELIRYCANDNPVCEKSEACPFYNQAEEDYGYYFCVERMLKQAADAIEDLQKQLREEKVDNVNLTGWLAEDCPLIEVQPHGRLIDADALLSLLDKCMFPSDMVTTTAVRMATNWIKDAPTIIEAEEDE